MSTVLSSAVSIEVALPASVLLMLTSKRRVRGLVAAIPISRGRARPSRKSRGYSLGAELMRPAKRVRRSCSEARSGYDLERATEAGPEPLLHHHVHESHRLELTRALQRAHVDGPEPAVLDELRYRALRIVVIPRDEYVELLSGHLTLAQRAGECRVEGLHHPCARGARRELLRCRAVGRRHEAIERLVHGVRDVDHHSVGERVAVPLDGRLRVRVVNGKHDDVVGDLVAEPPGLRRAVGTELPDHCFGSVRLLAEHRHLMPARHEHLADSAGHVSRANDRHVHAPPLPVGGLAKLLADLTLVGYIADDAPVSSAPAARSSRPAPWPSRCRWSTVHARARRPGHPAGLRT